MKKKLLLFIFLGLMVATQALAQTKTVTGKVTGADDKLSLPGVSVKVKGVNTAVQTNADGMYSIRVNESAVLQFSYLGYVMQEASVAGKTVLNIELVSDAQQLQEVVVTGYGVQNKRDVAGAVSSIKAADIENLPVVSFDKAMQGRMAGVQVQGNSGIPGGLITVRIRGTGSINAGNSPLYIIDGVQMAPADISRSLTSQNVLAGLNPGDIESIDVLKDAASAAIYGAQAANGVVIITTKKGKAGKTRFNVNYQTGVTDLIRKVPITNGPQFLEVIHEARVNQVRSQGLDPATAPATNANFLAQFGYLPANFASAPTYDWQDAMSRTGVSNTIELNASGGTENTTFYLSGSYDKSNGQIIRSDFKRGALRLNLDHKASEKLKFETKLNLATYSQNTVPSSNSTGSMFLSGITIPSIQPIYNADGSYAEPVMGTRPGNVIKSANYNKDFGTTNQLLGTIGGTYQIIKDLSFKSSFSLDYTDVNEDAYIDPRTREGAAFLGEALAYNTRRVNWTTDQVFSYAKKFGPKHSFSGLLGFSYRNLVDTQISATGQGFPNQLFQTLQSAANPIDVDAIFTTYRTAGYFTKLNYSFDDRYIANATLRYDGSSRFGKDKKYGLFPALSLAWRMSSESFLKDSKVIDDLKLRASYGVTGNQDIGNFDARSLFIGTGAYNGIGGINPSGLGNDVLSWEENHTINLGLDFALFNSRLSGAFDAFRRNSKNLLLDRPLPSTSGFTTISQNVGAVRNEGLEFELTSNNLTGNFKWNTSLNATFIKNKITALNEGQDRIGTTVFLGKSIGSIYVVEYAGVNAATGRPFWYDANNNITYQPLETVGANDARRIIGSSLPTSYGGITNTFSYKGVELSVFFQGQFGNTLINNNSFFSERAGAAETNYTMRVYDRRWRQPGDVTDWPRMFAGGPEPVNRGLASFSSRNYESGAYVRMKTVSLSYRFEPDWISKFGFRSASINLQGFNLWTITGYTGLDPEVTGADLGVYPQGKTITAGIQLGF